uniref:glycine-rich protein n=1 Tax=Rhabdothermincola sp. TaxID=2820405 RepID=UPI002FE111F5
MNRHSLRIVLPGALVAAAMCLPTTSASAADPIIETFTCTGAVQSWVVPAGVTEAVVDLYGAAGGDTTTSSGGLGGRATATISVTPGETIQVNVGCRGGDSQISAPGAGGFGGGGDGGTRYLTFGTSGAGGGGASDIRQGGTSLAHRVVVAGGGGGAAYS